MLAEVYFEIPKGPEVAALLEKLKGRGRKAISGAMKDIGKTVRTQMAKEIGKRVRVKYGSTLKRIRIYGPSSDLAMRIVVDEKTRPGLVSFGAKQLKRGGVVYRIAQNGSRKKLSHAFIRKGNNSGINGGYLIGWIAGTFTGPATGPERVFTRMGKSRLPVIDLKGPSINAVITKNDIDAAQKKAIETKLPDRILQRLRVADQRSR